MIGGSVRLMAAAIVVAGVLAGCSASSAAGTPAASGGATTAVSTAPAAGPSSGASGSASAPAATGAAACTLLTDADIKSVTTLGVRGSQPTFMSGVSEDGCDWTLDDTGGSEVKLAYVATGGRAFFDKYYAPFNQPLAGVGDAAVTTDAGAVIAVKDDAAVLVDYSEFPVVHKDAARKLLQAALAHLP